MKDQRGKHVKRVRAYDNARTGTPKRLEQNRKCYANTIDVRREYERKRYPIRAEALKAQNRKRWAEESDMMRDRSRKYYASDPAKYAARAAASRAERLKRVPDWLTDEQRSEIRDFYVEAKQNGMHVDHIVPLRGKMVSGLHVPWNLQLLTPEENQRKNNSFLTENETN